MSSEIDPQSELRKAFQNAWDKLVLDADIEPNLSLIAAYVDGRLSDVETGHLANHLLECPAAWEIMEQMLPEGMAFPSVPDQEVAPSRVATPEIVPDRQLPESEPRRESPRSTWLLAIAAGWGIALVCGGLIWRLQSEATDLRDRLALAVETQARVKQLEEQQRLRADQLVRLELTELAQQAATYRSVYLIGDVDLGMVRVAMQQNRVRGPEEPSKAAVANMDKTLGRIREALQDAKPPDAVDRDVSERLAEVAGLIMAGDLSPADAILTELEGTSSSPQFAVRNARAVWQIAQAASMPPAEARPLLSEAETTLREIAAAGESNAWLNLALFYIDQGRATDASLAAIEYLESKPHPAIAELVRQYFGFSSGNGK